MKAYSDKTLIVHQGDVLACLADIPDGSVHCVVTSPPYWGLRDYQVDGQLGLEKLHDCLAWARSAELCGECHVCRMVAVMREVRRVLRPDGTLWLNYGDSYAGSWGNYAPTGQGGQRDKNTERWERGGYNGQEDMRPPMTGKLPGLKPKDLVGMPWRVALALQADGWYLRSDIVWHKPNPMPGSQQDRPTKSHEYIFLLTKKARYYYDVEAVREEGPTYIRKAGGYVEKGGGIGEGTGGKDGRRGLGFAQNETITHGRNARTVWDIPEELTAQFFAWLEANKAQMPDVWKMATQAFKESHFATFPEELPRKCILAGTSEKGVCPDCGAPWVRVVEKKGGTTGKSWHNHDNNMAKGMSQYAGGNLGEEEAAAGNPYTVRTLGWRPSCKCGREDTVPATVLDPFGGSGTTGKVANELGRAAVLIELNPEYIDMLLRRNRQPSLL